MARINSLLVGWTGEWRERRVEFAYTLLRIEGFLSVGAVKSGSEADRLADAQLAINSVAREQITVTIDPQNMTDIPGIDYEIGDFLEDVGGHGAQRVVGRSLKQSGDEIIHSLVINDIWQEEQDRFDVQLKKMVNGTGRGTMSVATPISPKYSPQLMKTLKEEIHFEQEDAAVVANESRNVPVRVGGQPTICVELETPLATDAQLGLYRNRVLFATMDLEADPVELPTQYIKSFTEVFTPRDTAKTTVIDPGTGGEGLSVVWWMY